MRRTSDPLRWWIIPLAVLAGALHASSAPPVKPNILLMVGDDIGWGDIGCYGSTQIQTPNIDRLARGGMRFTSGYVTAAICSPSRAGMLTGRYQQRNGLENNRLAETQNCGLDLNLKTLADVLGGAGYVTGLIGKWHLGVGANKEYTPLRRGFQEFFGFYSYHSSYTPSTLIRGEEPVKETRRSTVAFADEACAFIDRHGNKPFFLEVAFNAAHTPLEGARKDIVAANYATVTDLHFTNSPANDVNRRNFCALVTEMDGEIGRIMDKLKEKRLEENTLVIYISDNGGWIGQGGNNGQLRGGKWGIYEGGQRVPFIWRWPGVLPAGKEYAEPVSTLDFMPTFAAMAGTVPPNDIDGLNLLPFLRGERQSAPHGDLFWKLNGQCAVVRDQWKAVRFERSPAKPELYDLSRDREEQKNLAGEKPDTVEVLSKAWTAWNATLPPAQAPTTISLEAPVEWQVCQRNAEGWAEVKVAGATPAKATVVEARAELQAGLRGKAIDWTLVAQGPQIKDGKFSGNLKLASGGWYTLKVRFRKSAADPAVLGEAAVAHVGVGDIFVVAGQSNAANHGAEKQKTTTGMVAAFDGKKWQLANDPQPGASGDAGSFVPPFGDAIATKFKEPVGIIACGIGATSVREWLPKGAKFPNPPTLEGNVRRLSSGEWESTGDIFELFTGRMKQLGSHGFRAVLWHQGESDADQPDPQRTVTGKLYRQYLEQLIRESRKAIGWDAPWFVALVSSHGGDGVPELRAAQQSLWTDGIALEGPDSDALRGDLRDGVHFSGKGLREHGKCWAESVAPWLEKQTGKPTSRE